MKLQEYETVIVRETMESTGYLELARSGKLNEAKYQALLGAIVEWGRDVAGGEAMAVSRTVVAALFEVPWELENASKRLRHNKPDVALRLTRMADELRMTIHNVLWQSDSS
jgi:hypothetical protein